MDVGGAYGGGKAGASFDPITFVQRPQVLLRAFCWVRDYISNIDIIKKKKEESIASSFGTPCFVANLTSHIYYRKR